MVRAGLRQFFADQPDFAVVAEAANGRETMDIVRQGASGYLNKDCDPEEIVKAIRTLVRGRKYITVAVAEQLAEGLGTGGHQAPHEHLSDA